MQALASKNNNLAASSKRVPSSCCYVIASASNSQAIARATAPDQFSRKTPQDRILIDDSTSGRALTQLKIAQAYVRLSSIPDDDAATSVSIAFVATCEIRMVRLPEVDLDDVALFWLELFDLGANLSIDSCCCHRIEDAVPIFEAFVAEASATRQPGDVQ